MLSSLTYFVVIIDHSSWKYWHSPMNHAKAMTVTIAYDIYLELCEGHLGNEYKIDKPVTFFRFREKLAKQMLHYSPKHRKYPGDDKFRCSTKQTMTQRKRVVPRTLMTATSSDDTTVTSAATRDQVEAASDRLCGDLEALEMHDAALQKIKSYRACVICGKTAYWKCTKCPDQPALHRVPTTSSNDNISCHIKYHNTLRFGITRAESTKRKWKEASLAETKAHVKQMRKVCTAITVANAVVLPPLSTLD